MAAVLRAADSGKAPGVAWAANGMAPLDDEDDEDDDAELMRFGKPYSCSHLQSVNPEPSLKHDCVPSEPSRHGHVVAFPGTHCSLRSKNDFFSRVRFCRAKQ